MAMNKSFSTTDVESLGHEDTLSRFITQRNKRPREEDLPTEFVKFKEEMNYNPNDASDYSINRNQR